LIGVLGVVCCFGLLFCFLGFVFDLLVWRRFLEFGFGCLLELVLFRFGFWVWEFGVDCGLFFVVVFVLIDYFGCFFPLSCLFVFVLLFMFVLF